MADWINIAAKYGVIGSIVILGWIYYRGDNGRLRRAERRGSENTNALEPVIPRELLENKSKKSKKRSQKANGSGSSTPIESAALAKQVESGTQQKNKTSTAQASKSSAIDTTSAASSQVKESDVGDKEFARQLQKAKEGTKFASGKKENHRVRTQKQSKISGSFADAPSTSSEFTASAEGESSISSPDLVATEQEESSEDKTGVADMLEAAAPGPVSLRITESLVPIKPKQQPAKREEVVEDKKTRQKRLKREREKEERKQQNREAEAQRKVQEEKQRRTAREAEGRPARNGNGWTYDSGLPANSWSGAPAQVKTAPIVDGGLLDTTEGPAKLPTIIDKAPPLSNGNTNGIQDGTNNALGHDGVNGSAQARPLNGMSSAASNYSSLPSEEEQIRMLQEEEEWTQVAEPKRGKRKNTNGINSMSDADNKQTPATNGSKKQTNYFSGEVLRDTDL